jgi:hypothetical protein
VIEVLAHLVVKRLEISCKFVARLLHSLAKNAHLQRDAVFAFDDFPANYGWMSVIPWRRKRPDRLVLTDRR